MLRKVRGLILLALITLAWNVTPAYSTVVTYNDLASWSAATSGDQTINFTGKANGGAIQDYSNATGVAYSDVQFIGITANGYGLDVPDTNIMTWYSFGTGEALAQPTNRGASDAVPYIHVVFTTPVTAFGLNLFSYSSNGMSFAATLQGTNYTIATSATAPPTFWGVTSDTPISSVNFALQGTTPNGGSVAFLDNLTYGAASTGGPPPDQTPEAATLLLIGSGLLGLVIVGKRIRPAQTV
jgi:hypothetical protein